MAIQKISNAVLGSGAVTSDSIATGAITVADIPDGEITTAKIGDNQITNAKMSDNSVNTAELWDGAVETQKIDNLAVTNAKLADDAVTPAKVDSTGDYVVNGLDANTFTSNTKRHSVKPSLLLDFANATSLPADVDFTRPSRATYWGPDGLMKTFEPYKNIAINSEAIADWLGDRLTIYDNTSEVTSPRGDNTASKVIQATTGSGYITNDYSQGYPYHEGWYNLSVYVRPGNSTNCWGRFYNDASLAWFNPNDGGWGTIGNNYANAQSQYAGDGWYRFSIDAYFSSNTIDWNIYFNAVGDGNSTGVINDYSYVWGIQATSGKGVKPYVGPTFGEQHGWANRSHTTSAGYNQPRFDHTHPYRHLHFYDNPAGGAFLGRMVQDSGLEAKSRGLLLEPAAANYEDHSWSMSSKTNGMVNASGSASFHTTFETKAPDGTYSASKFNFAGNSDRMDQSYWTITDNSAASMTMWLKGEPGTIVRTALLASTGGNYEPSIYMTGDWIKVTISRNYGTTFTGQAARTHAVIIRDNPGVSTTSYECDGLASQSGTFASYVYVWGFQIEQTPFPTSYFPRSSNNNQTEDEVSTRAEDNCRVRYLDFINRPADNNVKFTIAADYDLNGIDNVDYGGANDRRHVYSHYMGNTQIALFVDNENYDPAKHFNFIWNDTTYPGGTYTSTTAWTDNAFDSNKLYKNAASYVHQDGVGLTVRASQNGSAIFTDTNPNIDFEFRDMQWFVIGANHTNDRQLDGHVRRIAIYNTDLADEELQELTGE